MSAHGLYFLQYLAVATLFLEEHVACDVDGKANQAANNGTVDTNELKVFSNMKFDTIRRLLSVPIFDSFADYAAQGVTGLLYKRRNSGPQSFIHHLPCEWIFGEHVPQSAK